MPKAFVKIGKQIMIVEVTEAVMNVLEEGRHKEENFRHEARRHWNGKNFNEERMIANTVIGRIIRWMLETLSNSMPFSV